LAIAAITNTSTSKVNMNSTFYDEVNTVYKKDAQKCQQEAQQMLRQCNMQAITCRHSAQDNTIWVDFSMRIAKTLMYPITCRFTLFVALCDHNPPALQTTGLT